MFTRPGVCAIIAPSLVGFERRVDDKMEGTKGRPMTVGCSGLEIGSTHGNALGTWLGLSDGTSEIVG